MAMSPEQMPLAEVKNHLSEVVNRIQREHGRVVITKHGRPCVTVVSTADLESLEETLAILSNADLREAVRGGLADEVAGDVDVLTETEARELLASEDE